MNREEFRLRGKEMIDYICEYIGTLEERRVTPSIEPGYLKPLLPSSAPLEPEPWDTIMADVEKFIMPGVTHWQHPRFHAYFPSGNSYPSILGDMLSDGIGCIGFSWAASPACTELETIVLDWLGKAIGLPDDFLSFAVGSKGGGVIQNHTLRWIPSLLAASVMSSVSAFVAIAPSSNPISIGIGFEDGAIPSKALAEDIADAASNDSIHRKTSASECILVTMIAARAQAIKRLKQLHPFVEEGVLLSKLMAYCSKEAHSCVEKAAMICFVKLRILEPDEKCSLRGATLRQAMEEDEAMGLIPFYVSTTLGTTSCCSFDPLSEIGPICRLFSTVWLHVDAAYAGNAFILPELKYLLNGIEYADSFNTNPNKWLLVNYDCSTMWVRDRVKLTSALVVDPLYLQHGYSNSTIDYRHWGVPLSRRFRSLKLWFVLRSYGIKGIQSYIRHHCLLAKHFESLVRKDSRFLVCNEVKLGLVCFRLKGTDKLNEKLLSNINGSGKLHMVPANVNDRYTIRFCAVAQNASIKDVEYAWDVITEFATELIEIQTLEKEEEHADEVFELTDRKRKEALAYKRSFFVRMVSDPKIYNPKIAKALPGSRRHTSHVTEDEDDIEAPESSVVAVTTPVVSWISWPLAFLFQEAGANELAVRFRHLDTMVHLPAKKDGSSSRRSSYSPSPENSNSKSPARSPILSRKKAASPH